jgi:hypothetical protein
VTSQAIVTVNAGFDRLFCTYRKTQSGQDPSKLDKRFASSDDHCYTVMPHETVFRLNPAYYGLAGLNRPNTNGVNDMALKVFSSANNFPNATSFQNTLARNGMSHAAVDAALRDAVSFVGVATTPVDYLNTNQKDNLAVQVAGSCSIMNTGTMKIRPGQKIIWDLPVQTGSNKRKMMAGSPLDKKLFTVAPLESAFESAGRQNYDFVTALFGVHNHTDADPSKHGKTEEAKELVKSYTKLLTDFQNGADTEDSLKEYIKKILILYEEVRSRVIGIALSGADPGQQFDIMLCSSH